MSDSTSTITPDSRSRARRWRGIASAVTTALVLAATLVGGAAPANAGPCGQYGYCAPVGSLTAPTRPGYPTWCVSWKCGIVYNTTTSNGYLVIGSGVRWPGDLPTSTGQVGRGTFSSTRENINWQVYWVPAGSCGVVRYGDATWTTDRRSSSSGQWAPLRTGTSRVTVTTRWCS